MLVGLKGMAPLVLWLADRVLGEGRGPVCLLSGKLGIASLPL